MAVAFALSIKPFSVPRIATKAERHLHRDADIFRFSMATGGDTLSFAVQGVLGYAAPLRVESLRAAKYHLQTATGYQFVYCKGIK